MMRLEFMHIRSPAATMPLPYARNAKNLYWREKVGQDMKPAFRVLITFVVAVAAYFFVFWVPFALIPLKGQWWIGSLVSLLCAIGVGRYVWVKSESVSDGLASSVAYGALVTGGIGFSAGFFGPMIFAPGANQGPLLGIFITGPLGFLLGGIGGFVYWLIQKRKAVTN